MAGPSTGAMFIQSRHTTSLLGDVSLGHTFTLCIYFSAVLFNDIFFSVRTFSAMRDLLYSLFAKLQI